MTLNGFVVRRSNKKGALEPSESKDAMLKFNRKMREGSVELCRALLSSGALHGPMSMKQQTDAIEYAYGVGVAYVD